MGTVNEGAVDQPADQSLSSDLCNIPQGIAAPNKLINVIHLKERILGLTWAISIIMKYKPRV